MLSGIDHLVIVVPSLDTAVRNYNELGFSVELGGKHPIGTHNALIGFADGSYLELIAFLVEDSPHRWNHLLKRGGGFVDLCAQTDDLARTRAEFVEAGVAMSELRPLSRQRPDGYVLKWMLSNPQPPWISKDYIGQPFEFGPPYCCGLSDGVNHGINSNIRLAKRSERTSLMRNSLGFRV